MTTPTLLTDFIGYGLAANMPVSPNVPAGCSALYYQTDTTTLKVWNGAAWVTVSAAPAAPAVVQSAAASTSVTAVTFSGAPANGNLLVAFAAGPSISPAAGWSRAVPEAGVFTKFIDCFFKIAGAGESTTQTPCNSATDNLLVYEISGANLGNTNWGSQNSTAAATTLPSSKNSGGLIIGAAYNESDGTFPSSVTGASLDAQHANSTTSSITGFHAATSGTGSNTLTINSAASKIWGWQLLALFP